MINSKQNRNNICYRVLKRKNKIVDYFKINFGHIEIILYCLTQQKWILKKLNSCPTNHSRTHQHDSPTSSFLRGRASEYRNPSTHILQLK